METSFRCRISGRLLITSQRCDNDGLIWKPPHASLLTSNIHGNILLTLFLMLSASTASNLDNVFHFAHSFSWQNAW